MDARTYTTRDGYATAVFWVQDAEGRPYSSERLPQLRRVIERTLAGEVGYSTGQGFRAQPVQIGSRSGGMVAITGGLAAGTQIATTNAFLLKAEIEKESAE